MWNQRKTIAITRNPSLAVSTVLVKKLHMYLDSNFGKSLCVCSFCTLVISIGAQMYTSNAYAIKGYEMVSLMNKQANLGREVSKLELEVSVASSLGSIEDKARTLGFIDMPASVGVIKTSSTVAAVASLP